MIESRYTLDDFFRITSDGFNYKIDTNIIDTIQKLSDQVGAPEYIKTPQFPKRECVNNSLKQKNVSCDDWEHIRSFKATKMVKPEGIDEVVSSVRKHLNKLSEKNYLSVSEEICAELSQLVGEDEPLDKVLVECHKVGDAIFTIASGNTFYSKLYANLLKDLMNKFDFMSEIVITHFKNFKDIFSTIEYCSPNKDYDRFCEINKTNDKRRAIATFYVNLMKLEVIEQNEILNIIKYLQEYQYRVMYEADNTYVVDELSEVLFIMITDSKALFEVAISDEITKIWNSIVDDVKATSKLKKKDRPGITSKCIFKHMDILDIVNNKSN